MANLAAPWERFSAKEWSLALQSLTPGGSEFTEPSECVAYVRKRFDRQSPITLILNLKKEIQQLQEACKKALTCNLDSSVREVILLALKGELHVRDNHSKGSVR
jgi:hypothetical protein